MTTDRTRSALAATLVFCFAFAFGCGDHGEQESNLLLRVKSPLTTGSVEAFVTCGDVVDPTRVQLERRESESGEVVWEGDLELSLGDCLLTLELSCGGELACVSSGTVTAAALANLEDNVLEVWPLCSLPIPSPLESCFSSE